jgi:hypothetical protein
LAALLGSMAMTTARDMMVSKAWRDYGLAGCIKTLYIRNYCKIIQKLPYLHVESIKRWSKESRWDDTLRLGSDDSGAESTLHTFNLFHSNFVFIVLFLLEHSRMPPKSLCRFLYFARAIDLAVQTMAVGLILSLK